MSDALFFPATVVDFDGTIRHAKEGQEFINEPEDIRLYDSVARKLWQHRENGRVIFGLTNQGGVAYGHKTPREFQREVRRMKELFEDQGHRWPFHEWYAAYQMEGGSVDAYSNRSLTRKPETGALAILAERLWKNHDLRVDWDESIFVGDREEDFECARMAGMRFLSAERFRKLGSHQHEGAAVDPYTKQFSSV